MLKLINIMYLSTLFCNRNLVQAKIGNILFDSSGDRLASSYTILNIYKNQVHPVGKWVAGTGQLEISKKSIIWPGGTSQVPEGFEISSHFKVSIYVYTLSVSLFACLKSSSILWIQMVKSKCCSF